MNKNGIQADPAKTEAIIQMPWPVHQNVAEIQSFIGMVNQLSKFISIMLIYHFYITSAMTSYNPTCRKQSFQKHNTTIKFLHIHRDFVIHPTGFTSP